MRIAERCNVKLPKGEAHLPNFAVPPGDTVDSLLRARRRAQGFAERLPRLRELEARGELRRPLADYESRLTLRDRADQADEVPGYFLIVWDFIRYARERGIPVGPGRGSAAGSLVAYCLRITDVDPLHFDLYFERFLNPERVSLPDIDIDFCERRRGEVITYVTEKYGRENVAQIITFGTMKAQRRRARRRPRHGDADLRRGPGRQADPEPARHDARPGARGQPGARRAREERTRASTTCSQSPAGSKA